MIATALIVGGGVGGMTAAIALSRQGVAVTLIDADPKWRVYGAGISVTGVSLRAFDALGVLDQVRARGHVGAGMRGRSVSGEILFQTPVPDNPKPVQQGGGIMRPVLHEILSGAVREAGVSVRLGVKVSSLTQDEGGVDVAFDDGSAGRFDLLVGADGIYSQVRKMIFPQAPEPQFTGQGCWRVVAPRPAEVDRTEMYLGGPVKLGINPVSRDEMYMFILEHVPHNPFFEEEQLVPHVRALLEPFGGAVPAVRESIVRPDQVNYRPLEWLLLPQPWSAGRVVLIGDAAHATTPHMASGAGMAAEDGLVLAEELGRTQDVPTALEAFTQRRFERARLVVETSVRTGALEMAGDRSNDGPAMLAAAMAQLQQAY